MRRSALIEILSENASASPAFLIVGIFGFVVGVTMVILSCADHAQTRNRKKRKKNGGGFAGHNGKEKNKKMDPWIMGGAFAGGAILGGAVAATAVTAANSGGGGCGGGCGGGGCGGGCGG